MSMTSRLARVRKNYDSLVHVERARAAGAMNLTPQRNALRGAVRKGLLAVGDDADASVDSLVVALETANLARDAGVPGLTPLKNTVSNRMQSMLSASLAMSDDDEEFNLGDGADALDKDEPNLWSPAPSVDMDVEDAASEEKPSPAAAPCPSSVAATADFRTSCVDTEIVLALQGRLLLHFGRPLGPKLPLAISASAANAAPTRRRRERAPRSKSYSVTSVRCVEMLCG